MSSMNLEKLLPSSGGQVNTESTASLCSITSLLGLGGCRSRSDSAQSFAKKLQTKLWSLGPGVTNCATNGLVSAELDDEGIVSSSWVPSLSSAVTVEARLDVNRGVVTSVPVINRTVSINFIKKLPEVMERRTSDDHLIAKWMSENNRLPMTTATTVDQESDSSSTTNPLSDSDQYFDFGIETPLDCDSGSSSTGDETIAHELVLINHDDGLPIQPESGCIFGSPVLSSGEDSDEIPEEEDREETSYYESFSESSGNLIHKVNNLSLETSSSPDLEPTENGNEDLADFANHDAHARDSRDSSQEPLPRDDGARVDRFQSQGYLEGAVDNGDHVYSQHTCELATEQRAVHISTSAVLLQDDEKQQLNGGDVPAEMIPLDPVEYLSVSSDDISHNGSSSGVEICIDFGDDENSGFSSIPNRDADQPREIEEEADSDIVINKEEEENSVEEDEASEDSLFRHRVQRSTSLKTGKTPPGTPGRKKIVRFADALGLDLALVRTFLDEVPNVPPSAFSDLNGVEDQEVSSSPFALTISTFSGGRTTTSSYMPVSHSRILPPSNFSQQLRSLVASFTQPGSLPNFLELVKQQKICLETACLVDEMRLRGVVRVLNIDFHKSVIIRFTTDEWKTNSDQVATYVPGSCDGLSDRFSFSLSAGAQSLQPGQRLIFALCYRVGGQEIWDSNQGKNYVFQCISNSSYTPSIALQHRQSSNNIGSPDSFLHDSFLPYM